MHEFHLAEDLLKKILSTSPQSSKKIRVRVGETLAVTPDELREAFSQVAKGTSAEGAELEIEIVPLKMKCLNCRKDFFPREPSIGCDFCGSTEVEIISGKELLVKPDEGFELLI